jgi:hypothetical protein
MKSPNRKKMFCTLESFFCEISAALKSADSSPGRAPGNLTLNRVVAAEPVPPGFCWWVQIELQKSFDILIVGHFNVDILTFWRQ